MDKPMMGSVPGTYCASHGKRAAGNASKASVGSLSMAPAVLRVSMSFVSVVALSVAFAAPASAAPMQWKGYDWNVTDGGMAGVAEGKPANVSIDTSGALHLNVKNNAGVWTASELFTSQKLGFGSYQWLIEGPVDTFDKQIVLGLFP